MKNEKEKNQFQHRNSTTIIKGETQHVPVQ